jgi:hypothetical protein
MTGIGLKFKVHQAFPWVTPIIVLLFRHEAALNPLLCKERAGEVESVGYQSTITGSTIEGSAEATSPLPLLTKEGTLERSTFILTHANVGRPKFKQACFTNIFRSRGASCKGLFKRVLQELHGNKGKEPISGKSRNLFGNAFYSREFMNATRA